MTNRFRVLAVVVMVVVTGCVQSVNPFYTREVVVTSPIPDGKWLPIKEDAKPGQERRAWVVAGNVITAYEQDGTPVELQATYFKVDDTMFVDTTVRSGKKGQEFGVREIHTVPVHVVGKVELEGDSLKVTLPDVKWLTGAISKTKEVSLPMAQGSGGLPLFTASSQEWMAFLKKYQNDDKVFHKGYRLTFQRELQIHNK